MNHDSFDRVVTVDFETYYDKDYNLKKKELNTSEYVRDPRFKTQCVGIRIDREPVVWASDVNIRAVLDCFDWSRTALLCHHTHFDGYILSHHYGIRPAYYLDTLSMARALHGAEISGGLNEVASFYGKGNKLPNILQETKGLRDLPPELMEQLGQYCAVDVELTSDIFWEMITKMPQDELDLIDQTVRMFCDSVLELNQARILAELQNVQREKERVITKSGVPITSLTSSSKFANELLKHGVAPPTKVSPTTKLLTYAFSKSDIEFTGLLAHPEEAVRDLVKARLEAKSTIGETRAERFLQCSTGGQQLPVYLNYYGAHTGRWSGGNKMNLQNLPRGGELRKSILAPKGHVIVVSDSSQIEVRTNGWLAGDHDLLDVFRRKEDPYKLMAVDIYNIVLEEITKEQRFVGKVAELGLGFGMGADKFQHTLATGAMGPPVSLTFLFCRKVVDAYRAKHKPIVDLWNALEDMIYMVACNVDANPDPVGPIHYLGNHKFSLPNGLYMHYPDLFPNETGGGAVYYKKRGDAPTYLWGGILCENFVQALARICVSEQMLRIKNNLAKRGEDRANSIFRRIVTMTHDEVAVVVPEAEADWCLEMLLREMRAPPDWCKNIPLDAEGGYDYCYSK